MRTLSPGELRRSGSPARRPGVYQGALPEIPLGRIGPALQSIYGAEMEHLEARSRLTSVLQMMTQLRAEIVATLATLTPDASNGD